MHGDFGRTVPSLGSVLRIDCDILELDVEVMLGIVVAYALWPCKLYIILCPRALLIALLNRLPFFNILRSTINKEINKKSINVMKKTMVA